MSMGLKPPRRTDRNVVHFRARGVGGAGGGDFTFRCYREERARRKRAYPPELEPGTSGALDKVTCIECWRFIEAMATERVEKAGQEQDNRRQEWFDRAQDILDRRKELALTTEIERLREKGDPLTPDEHSRIHGWRKGAWPTTKAR